MVTKYVILSQYNCIIYINIYIYLGRNQKDAAKQSTVEIEATAVVPPSDCDDIGCTNDTTGETFLSCFYQASILQFE